MSINYKDHNDTVASSTIIMVDTCDDSFKGDEDESDKEKFFEVEFDTEKKYLGMVDNEKEALHHTLCGIQFDSHGKIAFAEHMQVHEKQDYEISRKRRNITQRKASLNLKKKYKSLIPNYKKDSGLMKDEVYVNEKLSATKHQKIMKNQGLVSMFKHTFTCQKCSKKFASQKALCHHQRYLCPLRENNEEFLVPLTMEEMATHLLTELANEDTDGNVLRSTKGLTVQTGAYVRPYVKKQGQKENDEDEKNIGKKIKTTKLWICPHCPDYVFERKRDQILHIRSVHGAIKRHVCDQCGKSLEGRSALALHMRIHTGERPFVCPTCGRGFSERQTMEGHTRRHTGERPFLCTECGKSFSYRQSLYRHMKFHTGERPHQCQICGKTFVLKQNLQEHIIRHEKHQLMRCTQCNAKFANKDLLFKHQLEVHAIENIVNNTEVLLEQPQELRFIDVSEMAVNPDVDNYEVTIDSQILNSYA